MTEEMLATLPPEQQTLFNDTPVWVNVCFAIGVIAGVLGCLLLLIRSNWAIACLVLSLVGVVGQFSYMFFMTDTPAIMGATAMVLPAMIVVISILLVPYSNLCRRNGLLN